MRIDDPFRIARCRGCIAHSGRRVFIQVFRIVILIRRLCKQRFIGMDIFKRRFRHIRAIAHDDVYASPSSEAVQAFQGEGKDYHRQARFHLPHG